MNRLQLTLSASCKMIFLGLAATAIMTAGPAWSAPNPSFSAQETPDADALNAYKRYWDAFQSYEQQKQKAAVEEYQRAREGLNSIYETSAREIEEKRLASLNEAIKRYQENLTNTPAGTNRPFVLLNMAQIYSELAFLQKSLGINEGQENLQLALTTLKDLEDNHPSFEHLTDALYLRASLLEANGETNAAGIIWKKLAVSGVDRFAMHGNLVCGDHEFENAAPAAAIRYYEQAKSILKDLPQDDRGLDELRIEYRLAWSYFKAGDTAKTLASIRNVLAPGIVSKSIRQRGKLTADLAELASHSLFALNRDQKNREFLSSKDFSEIGPKTALNLMSEFLKVNMPTKASDIGLLATSIFALRSEYPDILAVKAKADELAGRKTSRIDSLEKLSVLLPSDSLWRRRHQDNIELVKHMEDLARNAAGSVASSYYEEGLASGNPKKFVMASTYYSILLDDKPNAENSSNLRLSIANCQYFAGNLLEADRRYSELISALKTSEDVLLTAQFQRVLTLEKIWRAAFEDAVQKNIDPVKSDPILNKLNKLEAAVEEHANRFPSQSRSIDLLLVAASANRDHNRFAEASRFWQRALLSNPSAGQRAIAVRGLVFTKIRSGNSADVIETASNFLKLEYHDDSLTTLRQELLGVVASAAADESSRLAKKGSSEEAGTLLLQVVSDFPDLPNRDQMWRDGAYFLAISGKWSRAQASAESYLKGKSGKFSGDMTYLLARAHEYQLRFSQAVSSYLDLAEKNPRHARAAASLERAEKLALADNNFASAGRAAQAQAERQTNHKRKLDNLDTAISYYLQSGSPDRAMALAEKRRVESKGLTEKFESELAVGRIRYQMGEKQVALDDLDTLAKQIDRSRFDLGDSYKRLAAETNMLLGEHALNAFQEIKIDTAGANTGQKVEKKARLFSDLAARFDKVASLDRSDLSPKARFLVAKSAADFADEISGLPVKNGEPTTLKSQTRFNQNISRLREMAQRYHGNNILAKQRSPQAYNKNEWISRSAIALSGSGGAENQKSGLSSKTDQLSTASSSEMPQQWSH